MRNRGVKYVIRVLSLCGTVLGFLFSACLFVCSLVNMGWMGTFTVPMLLIVLTYVVVFLDILLLQKDNNNER